VLPLRHGATAVRMPSPTFREAFRCNQCSIVGPQLLPGNGTKILQEYHETCSIQYRPLALQVFQTVGTRDMLYPANVRLHEALERLRQDVVQPEFHLVCALSAIRLIYWTDSGDQYPVMTHLFSITSLTNEGADVKRKIARAILRF
jgi:hypothetical protein